MCKSVLTILAFVLCSFVNHADTLDLNTCQPIATADYPVEEVQDIHVFFDDSAVFYRYAPATNEKQQVMDFVPSYFFPNYQFALVVQDTETEKKWLSLNLATFALEQIFSEMKPTLTFSREKSLTNNRYLLKQGTGYLTLENWYVVDLATATMQQFPFPKLVDFMSVVDSTLVTTDERSKDNPYIYSFNANMTQIGYWAYETVTNSSQKPEVITRVQDVTSGEFFDTDLIRYAWTDYPNIMYYESPARALHTEETGLIDTTTGSVIVSSQETQNLYGLQLVLGSEGTVAREIVLHEDDTDSLYLGVFEIVNQELSLKQCALVKRVQASDTLSAHRLHWTDSGRYLWWLEPQDEFGRLYNLMLIDTLTGTSGIVMRDISDNTRIIEKVN